ncbi:MAG: MBL fold metallo-hydrolase [Endomicrobium sp.]|jgi:metal-dependent hydrolase (beta-lactamase superfamily II)|nr:MBL fold metallo-hydrolase [Endomicrobium sp.]
MLNFCIFASGSSGNCSLIRTAEAVVLIDCGVSSKYITENLSLMGLNPQDITAALITHAHGDHLSASGLNFLLKHNIKTYSHDCVFDDAFRKYGEKMNACRCVCVNASFKIKDIEISSFDVYHRDARVSKTLGFTLSSNVCARKYKIGYVTDTGKVCADMASHLKDSNILAIESNYDREMLEKSSDLMKINNGC